MKKNLLIRLMVIVLLLALCGCSNEGLAETGKDGMRKTTAGLNIQEHRAAGYKEYSHG